MKYDLVGHTEKPVFPNHRQRYHLVLDRYVGWGKHMRCRCHWSEQVNKNEKKKRNSIDGRTGRGLCLAH